MPPKINRISRLKKGFTILELLVVISVLAVLIGIAIPKFKGMKDSGLLAKAKKETDSIRAALESYRTFDSAHNYPPTTTTLIASYLSLATPKLVDTTLYDPFASTSSTEYNYLRSSNKLYYVVWSVGTSGQSQPTAISDTGDISY